MEQLRSTREQGLKQHLRSTSRLSFPDDAKRRTPALRRAFVAVFSNGSKREARAGVNPPKLMLTIEAPSRTASAMSWPRENAPLLLCTVTSSAIGPATPATPSPLSGTPATTLATFSPCHG